LRTSPSSRIFTRSASKNTSGFEALPRSRLQRPGLPGGDLVQHRIGDRADQVGRDLDTIQIQQVARDLARAHASRIHRDDLVVEARKAALVLRDQQRVEAALPVARHLQRHPAGIGRHALAAVAVAAVARTGLARQVMVHLGIQSALGQRLLQPVQQAALVEGGAGFRPGQQLVQDRVRDLRLFASGHGGAPSFPS